MLLEFNWILDRRLAGSARPGLLGRLDADLEQIRSAGISAVFTLTELPLDPSGFSGLSIEHFPIADMGFPTPRRAQELVHQVLERLQRDEAVLLHCRAGLGRTGTMLACILVALGRQPSEALHEIRLVQNRYVQTDGQEQFVYHFADHVRAQERLSRG